MTLLRSTCRIAPLLGLILLFSGTAQAESDRWNLHVDFGVGRPIVGILSAPGDDGFDRLVLAGTVALDWQVEAPWALEAVVGIGHQVEQSEEITSRDAGFYQFAIGGRRRFFDDTYGYADDPTGNFLGNLWVSAHLGYTHLDEVQFGLDVAAGYELSILRPVQIGFFLRSYLLLGGRRDGGDIAITGGLNVSVPLSTEQAPADSDGDGLTDVQELELGTNPNLPDTDNDDLPDGIEVRSHTNPRERDTDMDGLNDGSEDKDRDGVLDADETDPRVADTDRGGIPDGDEVRDPNQDPRDPRDDDSDRDGVAEPADQCPNTPQGARVGPTGCTVIARQLSLEGVQFASGRATILPESIPTLDQAAQMLRDNPDVRVEVGGHTDDVGSRAINRRLSRQRAQAVRDWLVENGIAAGRLTVQGYGSTRPVAPNDTPQGRARNRRIEFRRLDSQAED